MLPPPCLHSAATPGRRRPVKAASCEAGARHARLDGAAVVRLNWSRRAYAVAALQTEPPVSPKGPLDAAVVALQAGDVLADALLDEGLPGRELEAEPVVDHGEAPANEAGDAGEAATDLLANVAWHKSQAAVTRHLLAHAIDLL